ncbi:aspartyl-tRNA(Asn)/glutamyl-tRNA(Gln) amidotransferase subunit A [Hydrogenophaga palleronii]|uniref:Aspartyl-tRNA(Asn)/glutamyl-tRNA(Gln) amidotransferase subunit A n=1 Tax=Hydrogenophaga palleronii TaxID=65655 RepID=A0ABU1WPK5_9BURK|nr:amidase family protein [Hydrogenophaga palleronii]MDR7150967.1 aspartyl-tRNA(Asn)/glutamyl-tRNA(Gln) amidotransferase subunit A [Hydrogenophaga palleronii]
MSEDLCLMTAATLRRRIAHRDVSPVEVTRAVLQRAEQLQPELNCFITLCAEEAMQEAREAERAVMAGEPLGLLHGIPYTCKDIVNTRGVRTTFGSRLFENNIPNEDAQAVARMRRHGAILIGKTTTSEFGAKCLTDAPLFGRTRNACSAAHTSGGSSGGAAVAVAAGIAPLAIATDGGGSTRIPAACNGVVGLKQSLGTVPHSQAEDAFGNLTYVTPTTRTVADTALMLQAMAGGDPCDPWSVDAPVPDYVERVRSAVDLRGKKILFGLALGDRPVAGEVAEAFEAALGHLRALGAELSQLQDTAEFEVEPLWRTINHTVWLTRFGAMASERPDDLSPSLLRQLELATQVSGIDYQRAMFARTRLFRHVQSLLRDNDFIVTPTLSRTALPIDQDLFGEIDIDGRSYPELRANWFPWLMPFNLTGHPAVTLPCGFGRHGLPIGIQLVGRFRAEADLLPVAAMLESSLALPSLRPRLEFA